MPFCYAAQTLYPPRAVGQSGPVRLPLPPSGTYYRKTSSVHQLYSHFSIAWKRFCSGHCSVVNSGPIAVMTISWATLKFLIISLNVLDLRSFEIRFEFESDFPIRIRFESGVPIRKFRIGRTCRVLSYHKLRSLTVQQKHQPLRRL